VPVRAALHYKTSLCKSVSSISTHSSTSAISIGLNYRLEQFTVTINGAYSQNVTISREIHTTYFGNDPNFWPQKIVCFAFLFRNVSAWNKYLCIWKRSKKLLSSAGWYVYLLQNVCHHNFIDRATKARQVSYRISIFQTALFIHFNCYTPHKLYDEVSIIRFLYFSYRLLFLKVHGVSNARSVPVLRWESGEYLLCCIIYKELKLVNDWGLTASISIRVNGSIGSTDWKARGISELQLLQQNGFPLPISAPSNGATGKYTGIFFETSYSLRKTGQGSKPGNWVELIEMHPSQNPSGSI
jgi:hypothetical protein